jgi:hypothetical protein
MATLAPLTPLPMSSLTLTLPPGPFPPIIIHVPRHALQAHQHAITKREIARGEPIVIPRADRAPPLEQRPTRLQMAPCTRIMQRHVPVQVGQLDVGPELAQKGDEFRVAGLGSDVQGRLAAAVRPVEDVREDGVVEVCHA